MKFFTLILTLAAEVCQLYSLPALAQAPAAQLAPSAFVPRFARAVQLGEPLSNQACDKPQWPKASLRNEEQGVVTVSMLVHANGTVAATKIVKSSGFRDLDKATLASAASCRFRPTLIDGFPVQGWMQQSFVWRLE